MKTIIQLLMLLVASSYAITAFLLTFSEGANQEPTIYNAIGIMMFALPFAVYKFINRKIITAK